MNTVIRKTRARRAGLYRGRPGSWLMMAAVKLSALITAVVLLFIIGYIFVQGIPNLTPQLFRSEEHTSEPSH